jgi:hypothetical protein
MIVVETQKSWSELKEEALNKCNSEIMNIEDSGWRAIIAIC